MERLNAEDTLEVYAEASGWPMHSASLQLFDAAAAPEGLDVERVRELYRTRLPLMPLFRKRLVKAPGGLDRPVWVENPDVDVTTHIRRIRLPAPGTDRELAGLVGTLFAPRMDLTDTAWDITVIDGIAGGRVAVLARLHHSAVDGVRGLEALDTTFDLDPAAPIERSGSVAGPGTEVPGTLRMVRSGVRHLAETPVRMARTVGHLAVASVRLADVVRQGQHAGLALPLSAPRTPFNRPVSERRGFAFCSLPLGPVKTAARTEGVTVNDVVLALTGGALTRYLQERGQLPARSLTAGVPVGLAGTTPSAAGGGNRWEVMVAILGTDTPDPVERLHRIARSTSAGKAAIQAIGPDLWTDLIDLPPTLVSVGAGGYGRLHLTRFHPPLVNLTVSNVRGSSVPLYFAGARLQGMYPLGPIADGLGLNVTVISYLDSLDFGLVVCPDLVEDPWRLVDALRTESAELADRVGRY